MRVFAATILALGFAACEGEVQSRRSGSSLLNQVQADKVTEPSAATKELPVDTRTCIEMFGQADIASFVTCFTSEKAAGTLSIADLPFRVGQLMTYCEENKESFSNPKLCINAVAEAFVDFYADSDYPYRQVVPNFAAESAFLQIARSRYNVTDASPNDPLALAEFPLVEQTPEPTTTTTTIQAVTTTTVTNTTLPPQETEDESESGGITGADDVVCEGESVDLPFSLVNDLTVDGSPISPSNLATIYSRVAGNSKITWPRLPSAFLPNESGVMASFIGALALKCVEIGGRASIDYDEIFAPAADAEAGAFDAPFGSVDCGSASNQPNLFEPANQREWPADSKVPCKWLHANYKLKCSC